MLSAPMSASPFAALLGHLAGLVQARPGGPIPIPQTSDGGQFPTGQFPIGYFGPHGGGIVPPPQAPPAPQGQRIGYFGPGGGGIATLPPPLPSSPVLGQDIQPSLPGLTTPPDLGLFPHPDSGTAMAQIHQVLAHHHNALQSLIAAIHGLATAPVGVDSRGHTQPGIHSQSTHNATVARRSAPSHPLPLQ